jgi:nucleotide-binding universal stress UspA family protein
MQAIDTRTRIRLRNILYCTDLSPAAADAFPHAVGFASHFGAKLYVLYVRRTDQLTSAPEQWPATAELTHVERELKALLEGNPGIDSEALIKDGALWNSVESTIEARKIDLVVLGTRGRSGLARILLGSAAEEILRQAPCPVLTVGPHISPLLLRGGGLTRILCASDFSPESAAAAPYAFSLAQEYQARLTLLHVIADPKRGDFVQAQELVASCRKLLRDLVPLESELWCEPQFMVEQGPVAETILDVTDLKKANLIVLGVRRPAGVPGAATHLPMAIAHKVVSRANCPVLTVRA